MNPINARLIKEAIIKAIGIPERAAGTSVKSRRSLMPDINKSARVKPMPAKNDCISDKPKLNPTGLPLTKKLLIVIAKIVVIPNSVEVDLSVFPTH